MTRTRKTTSGGSKADNDDGKRDDSGGGKRRGASHAAANHPRQWHPVACDTWELELREYARFLDFRREYPLGAKPLQADLLITRTDSGRHTISNPVARIFRTHNIIEYKSPDDRLGINEYCQGVAYGCQYKRLLEGERTGDWEEITVTLQREGRPVGLLAYLARRGMEITSDHPGIYRLRTEPVLFPMQIVVVSELPPEDYVWFTSLTRRMDADQAGRLLDRTNSLPEESRDKEMAGNVVDFVTPMNPKAFNQLRKDNPDMYEATRRYFQLPTEEEIQQRVDKEVTERVNKEVAERVNKEVAERVNKEVTERVNKEVAAAREDAQMRGVAEGRAEGRAEGEITGMVRVYSQTLNYTPEQIAKELNQPVGRIADIVKAL